MNLSRLPDRDERTVAVENAGYRVSYYALSFGALGICAYRSFVLGQVTWDLLALVVVGGAVNTLYQGAGRVLYPRWAVIAVVSFVVAVAMALVFRWLNAGR
jgi:hypothetical protein